MNCLEMEEIDNTLEDAKALQRYGFMNMQHYKQYKYETATGMTLFGDSFSKALGFALMESSIPDSLKIFRYWNQLCQQYRFLYQIKLAKEKASASEE